MTGAAGGRAATGPGAGRGDGAGGRTTRTAVVERVEAALSAIDRLDPEVCAFVEVWEADARRRARAVDLELPLAGLPFAVKGRSGARARAARALVAAGAVPVGSTAVPGPGTPWQTWGLGRHGRTVNPYRRDRTPGGSSAGAAVAVATGMVPLAIGGDGAGSVRIPAAWCGVFGLKTTNGMLPSPDATGLASPGVLTRRVADAEAYLRHVAPGRLACPAQAQAVRLPVPAVFSEGLGFATVEADVARVVRGAVERLVAAGIVELVEPLGATTCEATADAAAGTRAGGGSDGTGGGTGAFALLDPGEAWVAVRAGEPSAAARVRRENDRRLAALFSRVPLLLTPVTPYGPHGHEGPGERYSTALTWAFNLSGHPAASVPAGMGRDGCPVGLQLVAERGADARLLAVCGAAEDRGALRPPTG